VAKLDPLVINMCYRHLQIAQKYAKELLMSYMFKNKKGCEELAEDVSYSLVWDYPEHSFAICSKEAARLGLNVKLAEDFSCWDSLWDLFLGFERKREKAILLLNKVEVTKLLEGSKA
jgi:hypothetical protein